MSEGVAGGASSGVGGQAGGGDLTLCGLRRHMSQSVLLNNSYSHRERKEIANLLLLFVQSCSLFPR